MAETQSFIDKSVDEWRRRLECASVLYDGATLFSKVDLTKLCHNVHNEVSLICAKFGADLITISKDTDHKTKWPRFLAYPVVFAGQVSSRNSKGFPPSGQRGDQLTTEEWENKLCSV